VVSLYRLLLFFCSCQTPKVIELSDCVANDFITSESTGKDIKLDGKLHPVVAQDQKGRYMLRDLVLY